MSYSKFIPCIFLDKGHAVKSFGDSTVVSMNPPELAKYYCDHHADELLVFDLSKGDLEHEENLGVMKRIAQVITIPMIGAGNIHRMEDVKKIIYAGCKKAVLNYAKEDNREITKEVSLKFGKEKIMVSYDNPEILIQNKELIDEYVTELLSINEVNLKASVGICNVKTIGFIPQVSLDKMLELLAIEGIDGVTGDIVNENAKEIQALKSLCKEKGINVNKLATSVRWSDFKLNTDGMLTVVVQDYKTDEVLMVAYMNEEAYLKTIETGKMTYFSRSRNELWLKGDTSGHYQYVKSLTADCDKDTLLAKVSQIGAACHTGSYSCFFNEIVKKEYEETNPLKVFDDVFRVIKDRKVNPKEGSYTNYLYEKGIDKILKKLGEEATEIVIAAKNPNADEIKYEIADFLYHMMVLMAEKEVSWEEITTELAQR